jgi:hypothetical protein
MVPIPSVELSLNNETREGSGSQKNVKAAGTYSTLPIFFGTEFSRGPARAGEPRGGPQEQAV